MMLQRPCSVRLIRKELDRDYHFGCQFTADVIAMNHADFIITSTLQARAHALPAAACDRTKKQENTACLPEGLQVCEYDNSVM